ncbi:MULTISPECIES: ATP-binding protein [Bacillus]|uniref:ATP-binding protein n=1 Tax=Bacillus TaxID=1386 RepID=UPI0002E1166F|nr:MULTISPECIES: ATP-binding protein [Bacillus]
MNDFVSLLGMDRAIDYFFKVRPDLIDITEEVKIENCTCSKCGGKTMFAWFYRLKGQKEFQEEVIAQHCNKCRDQIFSHDITLEVNQIKKAAHRSHYMQLPHSEAGFKNYIPYDNITRKALMTARDYTKRVLAGEKINLLIMGSTGTGKTHLSCAIARTLEEKGLKVGFLTAVELFKRIKDTFGHHGAEESLFKYLREEIDVMIIDDLGIETHRSNNDSSWSQNKWCELIDNRLRLPNVWTTNYNDTNLHEIVGERGISRMYEDSLFFDLFTKDYRLTKKAT